MCDSPAKNGFKGWRGWNSFPAPRSRKPVGDWVDLTHRLSADVPRSGMFSAPKITRVADMPEKPLSLSRIDTVVHMGTHLDSPRHFYLDGPAMEEVPLERFIGPGVVLNIDISADGLIEPAHLEGAEPAIEPGDIVAVHMGWTDKWGTPDWSRHPCFSDEAARWLREKHVKLLAVDTSTPDLPLPRRGPDFIFPVHRALLGDGILIAEQIANLHLLANRRVEFMFGPLPIEGSDGSPARVLARPVAA